MWVEFLQTMVILKLLLEEFPCKGQVKDKRRIKIALCKEDILELKKVRIWYL